MRNVNNIRVISHRKEVEAAKDEAINKAMEMIGLQMEGYAKEELSKPWEHKIPNELGETFRPTVDTGRLRGSITYATIKSHDSGESPAEASDYSTHGKPAHGEVVIGTNVEYAPHIEFGTSKMAARPYLRPALHEHLNEYKKMILSQLKG